MAGSQWMCFGMILTVFLVISLVVVAMDGDDKVDEARAVGEEPTFSVGLGVADDDGGDITGGGDDQGDRVMHKGETSSIRGDGTGTEDTFHDLPELSSEVRAPRLRQASIFEAITSSSRQSQAGDEPNQHMGEEDDDDSNGKDEEYDAESTGEEEAKESEVPVHRPAKRRWIF